MGKPRPRGPHPGDFSSSSSSSSVLRAPCSVQWKCVIPEVACANKPKCPQTLPGFRAKHSGDSEVD